MGLESQISIIINSSLNGKGFEDATSATNKLKKATSSLSINAPFKALHDGANSLVSPFVMLKGAIAALGIGVAIKESIKMADTFKLMEGRLSLVTNGYQELTSAQQSLFAISQNTRQSLESTTDLYTRIARSTKELGKSQSEMLTVTEAINKSFIISGSSAQSANAAIIQLGQGFASGRLNGDELRSVLENAPRLAEAIAKGMKVTVGQLREMGAEGKLTSEEVFKAIQSQSEVINKEFSKIQMTVGQSVLTVKNSIMQLVGEFDKATGASSAVSDSIRDMSKWMDTNHSEIVQNAIGLKEYSSTVVAIGEGLYEMRGILDNVVVGYAAFKAGGMIATGIATATTAISAMNSALKTATLSQLAFNTAAKANPYILGATILGTAGYFAYEAMLEGNEEVQKAYDQNATYWATVAHENTQKAKSQEGMLKTAEAYELKYQEIFEKTGQRIEAYKTQAEQLRKMATGVGVATQENLKFGGAATLSDKDSKKQTLESLKTYEDFYKSTGDLSTAWASKEAEIRIKNTTLSEAQLQKLLSAEKKSYFDSAQITKDRKKLEEDYYDYIIELNKTATKDTVDQEVLSQAYKYQKFLDEHKLSNSQKIALEKEFVAAIDRIQMEGQQETLKKQEDALLEYYKAIGNEVKAGEIQLKRYKEELDKTNLAPSQKNEMYSVAEKDYNRAALQKQLEQNERYYEAIGDYALAAQMKIEKLRLELERDNFSTEQIDKIIAAEEKALVKSNAFSTVRIQGVTTASEAFEIYKERVVASTLSYGEQIVTIMEDVSSGMNNSFESFFDAQSDNFMDFRNLANNILNDIYMSIMRTMVISPLVNSITSGIAGFAGNAFSSASTSSASSSSYSGSLTNAYFQAYNGGLIPYASGGYTGDGGKYEPKGVVHGGEYVIPQWMVKQNKPLVTALEVTRRKGYAEGGSVGGNVSTALGASNMKIEIINQSGTQMEVTNTKKTMDAEGEVIQLWISGITKNRYGARDMLGGN